MEDSLKARDLRDLSAAWDPSQDGVLLWCVDKASRLLPKKYKVGHVHGLLQAVVSHDSYTMELGTWRSYFDAKELVDTLIRFGSTTGEISDIRVKTLLGDELFAKMEKRRHNTSEKSKAYQQASGHAAPKVRAGYRRSKKTIIRRMTRKAAERSVWGGAQPPRVAKRTEAEQSKYKSEFKCVRLIKYHFTLLLSSPRRKTCHALGARETPLSSSSNDTSSAKTASIYGRGMRLLTQESLGITEEFMTRTIPAS